MTFWKYNFKCNLQEHQFLYFAEVAIICYPNFITCLYWRFRASTSPNSSHCQLMESLKRKESFSGKSWFRQYLKNCIAKDNFRVTSIKIIIRNRKKRFWILWENIQILNKRWEFIFCIFYLNEKELIQQICLRKYIYRKWNL